MEATRSGTAIPASLARYFLFRQLAITTLSTIVRITESTIDLSNTAVYSSAPGR
jgi:hypothetical protein